MTTPTLAPAPSAEGLRVDDLVVRFGGNTAVDHVSLDAPTGCVTGLIGPNGAGKTTTFNACSGLLRPQGGRISLFGTDVTRLSPSRRARLGLGRTFQRMELVDAMTVRTNVTLGAECRAVGSDPVRQIWGGRSERTRLADATEAAIDLAGLGPIADRRVGTLSTGQRRLVELARVLAGGFPLVLADEPSSGLDEDETEHFGRIVRAAVAERGIGVLLVEHDMALVMSTCARIFVLDFGRLLFAGTPHEVQSSELVQAAYLGSDAVEAVP